MTRRVPRYSSREILTRPRLFLNEHDSALNGDDIVVTSVGRESSSLCFPFVLWTSTSSTYPPIPRGAKSSSQPPTPLMRRLREGAAAGNNHDEHLAYGSMIVLLQCRM